MLQHDDDDDNDDNSDDSDDGWKMMVTIVLIIMMMMMMIMMMTMKVLLGEKSVYDRRNVKLADLASDRYSTYINQSNITLYYYCI
jgi:hypothetical protein